MLLNICDCIIQHIIQWQYFLFTGHSYKLNNRSCIGNRIDNMLYVGAN